MVNERRISRLDDANTAFGELRDQLAGRVPAVFLDYDGTLTGIVDDPADATLDDDMRAAIRELAEAVPVAVVSGRDLDDVRDMVSLDGIAYAGSHGFDLRLADGSRERYGEEYLADLDEAETALRGAVDGLDGVRVERKGFAIALHTRGAGEDARERAHDAVARVGAEHPRLKVTGGKDIEELRPNIDWDKGRALTRLMEVLGLDERHAAVYVGDDLTDEDGFATVTGDGVAVVVTGEEDRPTRADFRLPDIDSVAAFLRRLAGLGAHPDGAPG